MKNILDYIKYYKSQTFDEVKFNVMDALIYSILVYIPVMDLDNGSTLKEMYNNIYSVDFEEGSSKANSINILDMIKDSVRFKDVKIYDYIKKQNEEVQFGAMTIRNSKSTFIAFEGTNGTTVGWIENFYLSCNYPTNTQKEAINYLNNVIKLRDKNVYIGGHSKGGNLAMVAGMECYRGIYNRIRKIYNFDGPGFRIEQFNSNKFKLLSKKVENILPDGSIIGVLLNNDNYKFVKSDGIGMEKHTPLNWHIFGEFFIEDEQSSSSKSLHESTNKSVEKLKDEELNIFIGNLSRFFDNNNIKTINDLKDKKARDVFEMINQIKNVDEKTKKQFIEVLKVLINP